MEVLLVESFYTGSHKQWLTGLIKHTTFNYTTLTLPGRHWKWRMQGAAIQLAKQFKTLNKQFDLVVASDMLNLPLFKILVGKNILNTPFAIYFHENQLTYPWSITDTDTVTKRDAAYQFINYTSALVADKVWFNSQYHYNSFLNALPHFLKQFPDYNNVDTLDTIKTKSKVLYLGLNLSRFDAKNELQSKRNELNDYALILWNHRWEYDKNPDLFFNTLLTLKQNGVKFKLAVLGEQFKRSPEIFSKIPELFKDELIQFGFCKDEKEYIYYLQLADILPVTAVQDFFGISVVEAMYCNTIPLLPKRLAYVEHIPQNLHNTFFYEDDKGFTQQLQRMIFNVKILRKQNVKQFVQHYNWNDMQTTYKKEFEAVVKQFTAQ